MNIKLADDVAATMQALAERPDVDLNAVLRDALKRYEDDRPWATLADLARHAQELNMASGKPVNTAGNSREILNTEYVDYLRSRIDP